MDDRFDQVDSRFDQLNARFDRLAGKNKKDDLGTCVELMAKKLLESRHKQVFRRGYELQFDNHVSYYLAHSISHIFNL